MPLPFVSSPVWGRAVRGSLLSLVVAAGASYLLLGNAVFHKAAALLDRAAGQITDNARTFHLRLWSQEVEQSSAAFEELLACQENLEDQIQALQTKRSHLAAQCLHDSALLRTILVLLADEAPSVDGFMRADVERDAADVLQRVQARRAELEECEALLSRLAAARANLSRKVSAGESALRQQAEALRSEQVLHAGQRAYSRGLDLARRIGAGEKE